MPSRPMQSWTMLATRAASRAGLPAPEPQAMGPGAMASDAENAGVYLPQKNKGVNDQR